MYLSLREDFETTQFNRHVQTLDSNIKIVWHLHHLIYTIIFPLTSTVTSQPNMALTIKANEKYFP